MEDTNRNLQNSNLDYTKIAALQQKRTLAFVNHFVITTVQFLNSFMKKCEFKLIEFERKLEKVEAAMVLLEARLSSIPEVNIEDKDVNDSKPAEFKEKPKISDNIEPNSSIQTEDSEVTEEPSQTSLEYVRFVKMVQVGVPVEAVKLKVSLEGLDPNVFEKIMNK